MDSQVVRVAGVDQRYTEDIQCVNMSFSDERVGTTDAKILRVNMGWAETKRGAHSTELQKHSRSSREKSGKLLQNLGNIFWEKNSHSSTIKTRPCTTIPLWSTKTSVSSLLISSHLISHTALVLQNLHWICPWDVLDSRSSVSQWLIIEDWTSTHTQSSGGFWKAIKSETWLRPHRLPWNLGRNNTWVTLSITMAPIHFQPAMSTEPGQLECRSHCNAWRSVLQLYMLCNQCFIEPYLSVIYLALHTSASHKVRHEIRS